MCGLLEVKVKKIGIDTGAHGHMGVELSNRM